METKQERREAKREKERKRMPKHGRNIGKIYADVVRKNEGKNSNK
jgi:hypothetical protein